MHNLSEITFSFSNIFNFEGITSSPLQILVFLLVFIILIAVICIVIGRKKEISKFTSHDIVFGSTCLAISYVLSLIGFSLPFGGTVTFCSLLPISLYCHYSGVRKSIPFAICYMLLNLITFPFIISVWSMLLDYIIPYFSLIIVGIMPHKNTETGLKSHISYYIFFTVYIIIRFISHVISGMIFWDYSLDYGMTSFAYSCLYNSFCLIDFAIATAASIPFLSSKQIDKLLGNSLK